MRRESFEQVKSRKESKNRKILISICCVCTLVVVGICSYLTVGQINKNKYNSAIRTAEKYLVTGSYEDAIVAYKEAIELNEGDAEAYMQLAQIYISMGDFENALSTLNAGYQKTKSAKIQYMLNTMSNSPNEKLVTTEGTSEQAQESTSEENDSTNLTWDTSFLLKLESGTFSSFKSEYGPVVENTLEGEVLVVKHQNIGATFYYKNTASNNKIIDKSSKTPSNSAMPFKISLGNVGMIFKNYGGHVKIATIQNMIGIRIKPKDYNQKKIIELEKGGCIIRVECDDSGDILGTSVWNEIELTNANKQSDSQKEANVKGVVVDATTGRGVSGASVVFKDRKNGQSAISITTISDGSFSVDLSPSKYDVEITASGYTSETFDIEIVDGKSYTGLQYVISPELSSGEARIVLEWGAQPTDLDSYLVGRTNSGVSVDVNYTSMRASSGGNTIAELDVDDTTGYGPETITLYDLNGTYRFTVKDFRKTGTMSQYGATVKVYLPGKSVETISLNSSVENVWDVFDLKDGSLTILNRAG